MIEEYFLRTYNLKRNDLLLEIFGSNNEKITPCLFLYVEGFISRTFFKFLFFFIFNGNDMILLYQLYDQKQLMYNY